MAARRLCGAAEQLLHGALNRRLRANCSLEAALRWLSNGEPHLTAMAASDTADAFEQRPRMLTRASSIRCFSSQHMARCLSAGG